MRLFINSHEIDLFDNERISYTKQVNSLSDIAKRDSNFTEDFKIPKTAKNMAIFEGLGITGSTSPLPYQKNTARLFVGNICMIYKGWTIFEEVTSEYYDINIYDGHIDFMKQLDNKTFDDVDLSEISHTKEVPVIKDNWENGNPYYRYLVADFNGKTHFENGGITYINSDYLIPSVSVKYLWERMFQTFGFTFSGSVFQEEEFNDLYLTYPKGVTAGEDGNVSFRLTFPSQEIYFYSLYVWSIFRPDLYNLSEKEMVVEAIKGEIISNTTQSDVKHWKCTETANYRIRITGSFTSKNASRMSFIYLGKNLHNTHLYDNGDDMEALESLIGGPIAQAYNETVNIDIDVVTVLFSGETLGLYYYRYHQMWDSSVLDLQIEVIKVDQTMIDQIEFFKNLTPKDFYKEILWRFGLTPFPAKDTNHIEFLTYEERINGETLDWSDKFVKKISEKYVYDKYAKSNYFRFKYNGEGDEFNDGVIKIENENLEEKVDIIKSKTYSVERNPVQFLIGAGMETVPKMELWEKEPTEEDGQVVIQYNPRDSRFTFVRENVVVGQGHIGSEQLQQYDSAVQVRTVEHYNYSWENIILKRYGPIGSLFKNTKIIEAELHLSEAEFDGFDLKPTIHVEQLGGEFLVDKITKSDLKKKTTTLELIKINR